MEEVEEKMVLKKERRRNQNKTKMEKNKKHRMVDSKVRHPTKTLLPVSMSHGPDSAPPLQETDSGPELILPSLVSSERSVSREDMRLGDLPQKHCPPLCSLCDRAQTR